MLERVNTFNYLRRILSSDESEWIAVVRNLHKVKHKWGRLYRMIVRKREDTWTYGRLYVTVVQYVLLFGSEMCMLTPHILREVGSLLNWESH